MDRRHLVLQVHMSKMMLSYLWGERSFQGRFPRDNYDLRLLKFNKTVTKLLALLRANGVVYCLTSVDTNHPFTFRLEFPKEQ